MRDPSIEETCSDTGILRGRRPSATVSREVLARPRVRLDITGSWMSENRVQVALKADKEGGSERFGRCGNRRVPAGQAPAVTGNAVSAQ